MLSVPFDIEISENAMRFVFTKDWKYSRHYPAVFNSQQDLVPKHMPAAKPWAMVTDWRGWLVQVPECERLCLRCLGEHMKLGMTHYAVVIDDHPITRWQVEKVKSNFPSLNSQFFFRFEDAYEWLSTQGFSTEFEHVDFDSHWLNMSQTFKNIVYSLNDIQPCRFGLTCR